MTVSQPPTADCSPIASRLQVCVLSAINSASNADKQEVLDGLTQTPKSLPSKYFYDDRGSLLFEQICGQPEYYPTRTEAAILQQYAAEIAETTGLCELVELGSGSSTKTRALLNAYQALGGSLRYVPIDVSGAILQDSAHQLLADYPELQVQGLVGTYEQAIAALAPTDLPARMLIFLGSTLGNLNPAACHQFFANICSALNPGEYFLLGVDLQKPAPILEAAYNDANGITAQFNLNILEHLNWRFSTNFVLKNFEHWAFFNEEHSHIEMHLRCRQSHTVQLDDRDIHFAAGETIHTEISRKFNLTKIQQELNGHGLEPIKIWTDENQWFGVILCCKCQLA